MAKNIQHKIDASTILAYLRPASSLLCNLALAYIVYMLARVVFLAENYQLFADGLTVSHLWELFRGALVFDTSAILYTNALWVVLVLLPMPDRWHGRHGYQQTARCIFVAINTLALITNLCDAVYFRFSMRRTTTTIFQEFQNEGNLGSIFLHECVSHWYLFLLTVIVCWALWRLYRSPQPKATVRGMWAARLLSLLMFVPFCVAGMRGGWTRDIRPITISNANNYCDRPTEAALVLNTPFSMIRTIGKNNFEVPAYYQTQELEQIYTPLHSPDGRRSLAMHGDSIVLSDTVGMKRKNVVVIIIESFGREYIGAYNRHLDNGRYRGYTPFTDSLIHHGALTYTHSYCNGRKSIDGMPSILSGIPMFVEPFFLSPYSVNNVSGLADCLNSKGYETAFFHGAERGSMGFMAFARATKFQQYYGREDYAADPRTGGDNDFDGWWGISDEPFMQYFCHKMTDMSEPFMTALFTLSSHHPFRVPAPYRDKFKEEELEIHKVIRYADMSLQHFFASARQQPWFNNTVFAITSDHTNMSNHAEYQTDLGGFASPVIFYDPSGEMGSGMVDAVAQQTDIMPTILGHLGYDKPFLSFGIDLLRTPHDSTWAVNYLNGIYQYVKHGHVLQWDGKQTMAVYSLRDSLMQQNMVGQLPQQPQMERELKAIIQQYMERMTTDRLLP